MDSLKSGLLSPKDIQMLRIFYESGKKRLDKTQRLVLEIYHLLYAHFGYRHWWPGESAFEIIIGAILTQNTNWKNVERAIKNLKDHNLFTPEKLAQLDLKKLEKLIRPSGYYHQKALRIKQFLIFFLSPPISGSIEKIKKIPTAHLRKMLLGIKGIGPETADSILLYALGKKVFVIDAYTRRIFSRLGLVSEQASYEQAQNFFEQNLPKSVKLYNDYHAQIVELGKTFCLKKPNCGNCPLKQLKRCKTIFAKHSGQ